MWYNTISNPNIQPISKNRCVDLLVFLLLSNAKTINNKKYIIAKPKTKKPRKIIAPIAAKLGIW